MFKPATTDTLRLDGKNEKIELSEDHFQTMLKMQPEKSKAKRNNLLNSFLRKEALQIFIDMNASIK